MIAPNEKDPDACDIGAFDNQSCKPEFSPKSSAPEINKAFAMFLYDSGAADLTQTQNAFNRHPNWRSA